MYFLLEKNNESGSFRKAEHTDEIPKEVQGLPKAEEIHGCLTRKQGKNLCATIQIPIQEKNEKKREKQMVPLLGQGHTFAKFSFLIMHDAIWLCDYDGVLENIIKKAGVELADKPVEQLLYRLFCKLVENDVQVLDVIYKQLAALEGEIPKENARFFLQKMYTMKHSIYQLFRYYHQLTEMADDLMEWDGDFLNIDQMECFSKFVTRTKRLSDDMEIMREYAMEIWEIYQSQINIRQNDIMKVLTIVTTIFLPLSLLAGWYGMNFEHMPEIAWEYGYPMVILLSVGIVIFCLVLFRRKRYW